MRMSFAFYKCWVTYYFLADFLNLESQATQRRGLFLGWCEASVTPGIEGVSWFVQWISGVKWALKVQKSKPYFPGPTQPQPKLPRASSPALPAMPPMLWPPNSMHFFLMLLCISWFNALPSTWPPYWPCKILIILQGLAQMLPSSFFELLPL